MDEPYAQQINLVRLSIDELAAVARVFSQYVTQVWHENGYFGIALVNIPLMLLNSISETIQVATHPKEIGEPTDGR